MHPLLGSCAGRTGHSVSPVAASVPGGAAWGGQAGAGTAVGWRSTCSRTATSGGRASTAW